MTSRENVCFLSDVPFLPLQMPQGIQEKEKSTQSEVDEGIQKVSWQRAASGMRSMIWMYLHYASWISGTGSFMEMNSISRHTYMYTGVHGGGDTSCVPPI